MPEGARHRQTATVELVPLAQQQAREVKASALVPTDSKQEGDVIRMDIMHADTIIQAIPAGGASNERSLSIQPTLTHQHKTRHRSMRIKPKRSAHAWPIKVDTVTGMRARHGNTRM